MSEHSTVVGSSTAARVIGCPGSRPLAAKMPKGPPSVYAQEGSALHKVMELFFRGTLENPEDAIGSTLEGIEITAEHIEEKVNPALDMFDELLGDNDFPLYIEERVDFPDIPGAFGTIDLGTKIRDGQKRFGLVVDWKFGYNPVDATDNAQLKFGALALARKHRDFFEDCAAGFRTAIIQPGYPLMTDDHTWGALSAFQVELMAAVAEGDKENPAMAEGPWCRWCPAQPACPLKRGLVATIDVTEKDYLEVITLEDVSEMLGECDRLEDYIKAVRNFAYNCAEAGAKVPGYKLVAKRPTWRWLDDAKADKWMGRKGLKPADRRRVQPITPQQAKKLLKLDEIPATMAEAKSSGTVLVPVDDPRAEVLSGATALEQLSKKLPT